MKDQVSDLMGHQKMTPEPSVPMYKQHVFIRSISKDPDEHVHDLSKFKHILDEVSNSEVVSVASPKKKKMSKFLNIVKSNYLQSIKGPHRDYNKIRIKRDDVQRKIVVQDIPVISTGGYVNAELFKDHSEELGIKKSLLNLDVGSLTQRIARDERLQPSFIIKERRS